MKTQSDSVVTVTTSLGCYCGLCLGYRSGQSVMSLASGMKEETMTEPGTIVPSK